MLIDKTSNNSAFCWRLTNSVDALSPLAEAVENFGQRQHWDISTVSQINLALEELIINTISHGFSDGRQGHIEISITADEQNIFIRITDDGDQFDPFAYTNDINLSLDLAERPIGGLGIFLVRRIMDSYSYCYSNQLNQVSLTKRLLPEINHD